MRFFCFILCVCLLAAPLSSRAQESIWYLRIIARDDSAYAQAEKISLRDRLLPLFPERADDLPFALPRILSAAQAFTDCKMQLRIWSPNEKIPPAPTVYITVGEGGGHNWWGILYQDAYLWAGMPEANSLPADEIHLSWPWLQWLFSLFTAPQECPEEALGDSAVGCGRPGWR